MNSAGGAAPLSVGQRAALSKTITQADIEAFAALTGDRNPVHLDEAFARRHRSGRPIAHGGLVAGLISAALGTVLPGPGAIYLSQTLKFLKPVYPGDTVTATVEVTAYREGKGIVTLRTVCANQSGDVVIDGAAVLLIGGRADRPDRPDRPDPGSLPGARAAVRLRMERALVAQLGRAPHL